MDKNISETIRVKFDNLKNTRIKIKKSVSDIDTIKDSIKRNYIQYIQQERCNYFGLDSFHFQNKAIELEYNNTLELYHFIDNRIYGDYYKLFIMINDSLKTQLTDSQLYKIKELKHFENYPIYKDLEPFKIYEFDLINQIHQDIILILTSVDEIVLENQLAINNHQKHLKMGLNIDNYIINQEYKNQNLKLSNKLHENYLQVFHKYHDTLLQKFYQKIRLFYKQICHHKSEQESYDSDEISDYTIDSTNTDFEEEEINNKKNNQQKLIENNEEEESIENNNKESIENNNKESIENNDENSIEINEEEEESIVNNNNKESIENNDENSIEINEEEEESIVNNNNKESIENNDENSIENNEEELIENNDEVQ